VPEFNLVVNQTCAASESTPLSQPGTNVRRVRALVFLLLCAGGLWFLIPNSAPSPEVTILPPDYSVPAPPLPIPDRWIPMTWRWLWRLRSAVLPPNPTIDIETRLVRLGHSGKSLLAEALEGRTPFANSNGVHAWILSEQELLDMFGKRFKQKHDYSVRISRMTTGPGVLANQSMTTMLPIDDAQVSVGDSFTQAVLKRGKSVELTGSFISWEAVTNNSTRLSGQKEMIRLRTNLTLVANLLIPSGWGVFLLDTNRANTESSGTGLFISAKLR
jgi:hypothetical protein